MTGVDSSIVMKRGRSGLSRDILVEIAAAGASCEDSRTLDPYFYLPGAKTRLLGEPQHLDSQCAASSYEIQSLGIKFVVRHYVDADRAKENTFLQLTEGTDGADVEDTDATGLTIWPASFLLIEWLALLGNKLSNLSILELGDVKIATVTLTPDPVPNPFTKNKQTNKPQTIMPVNRCRMWSGRSGSGQARRITSL